MFCHVLQLGKVNPVAPGLMFSTGNLLCDVFVRNLM